MCSSRSLNESRELRGPRDGEEQARPHAVYGKRWLLAAAHWGERANGQWSPAKSLDPDSTAGGGGVGRRRGVPGLRPNRGSRITASAVNFLQTHVRRG